MPFSERSKEYWDNKFLSYLHDPFDKMLDIKTHEERAKIIIEQYGLQIPNEFKELWKRADGVASGFERGVFPDRDANDPNKDGSIEFKTLPVLSHPIHGGALKVDLTTIQWNMDVLKNSIAEIIGTQAGSGGYSAKFAGNHEQFVKARFIYTHLALRFKLAHKNVAGLGSLWHKLPADSRIPDHSIWHHNALVSAMVSCMNPDGTALTGDIHLDNSTNNIGIMIFTVTPVQSFIGKARKLRDYWTGSIVLSWLAFEGIQWVIENLGPDHILYPSLLDQPLILEYLKQKWHIDENDLPTLQKVNDIATFPNKVMLLVPLNYAQDIGEAIEKAIKDAWKALSTDMLDYLKHKLGGNHEQLEAMFKRQNETYWDISWVTSPLITNNTIETYKSLLNSNTVALVKEQIGLFQNITHYNIQMGKYYPLSNMLAQSALGNLKLSARNLRPTENGKKCSLCGELEALTNKPYSGNESANDYKINMDTFWDSLRSALGENSTEIQDGEQLCAICLTKRLLARMFNEWRSSSDHVLHNTFKNYENFPSTSYIALQKYQERNNISNSERVKLAQTLFDQTEDSNISGFPSIKIRDRYYAILIMDGDNMGKLINGDTIGATWGTVIHPEIRNRMSRQTFDEKYRTNWNQLYDKKRLVTPALHASISEALGDFALYGVPQIIDNYHGRLIYAGGDDVCAIMPIDTVIQAAKEIADYYTRFFSHITQDGTNRELKDDESFVPTAGKLCHGMGKAEGISISAGILLCHYKEPLSSMISRAHALLDGYAKEKSGRNSCAIELKKRSGGSRYFYAKWDNPCWESYKTLLGYKTELLSKSCIYNLDNYEVAFTTILETEQKESALPKVKKMLASIVKKSIEKDPSTEQIDTMTNLIIQDYKGTLRFTTDPLKILAFLRGEGNE